MRLIFLCSLLLVAFLTGCSSYPPEVDLMLDVGWEMKYQADEDQYGVSDKWVGGCPRRGDCEDVAICFAERLVEDLGASAQEVSFTSCSGYMMRGKPVGHVVVNYGGKVYDPFFRRVSEELPAHCKTPRSLSWHVVKWKVSQDVKK